MLALTASCLDKSEKERNKKKTMNSFDQEDEDDDDDETTGWDQEIVASFETTTTTTPPPPEKENSKYSRWSRTSSAPNVRTAYKQKKREHATTSKPSPLRYNIAVGAVRRSVNSGPFQDTENTFWPKYCEIFVYRDGGVMINARYTDIPENQFLVYLDGISTKTDIETILVTSDTAPTLTGSNPSTTNKGRTIEGFTPPTRLDHLSVEEIARTVSEGNLGVMPMTRFAIPPGFNTVTAAATGNNNNNNNPRKTKVDIENSPDIIWGKVMPNSMPSGVTLHTAKGSVVHVSASPQNAFIFPMARVDHRIRLALGKGRGSIQLSYFTGGLEISPEAVVKLTKIKKKTADSSLFTAALGKYPHSIYTGDGALFLRTQNSTATKFEAKNLRLSMARVGFRRRRRGRYGRGNESTQNKSFAESVSYDNSASDAEQQNNQTRLGPIEVFEYRDVSIPMGSNYIRVIDTPLNLDWTLQYDISDVWSSQPDIYGGIQSKGTNIPPSELTFIVKGMRVGVAQLRTSLQINEIRYVYLGQDSMIEIQNMVSRETVERFNMLHITSRLHIVNRKKTKVSLTLYRNLTIEEEAELDKSSFELIFSKAPSSSSSKKNPFGAAIISVEDIPMNSPRFVTKRTDTTRVLVIHLYNIPGNGGLVKVKLVVTRPYKTNKSMQKVYLYQKKVAAAKQQGILETSLSKPQKKNSRLRFRH